MYVNSIFDRMERICRREEIGDGAGVYGFVELAAGAHKIELRYCTPGLKVGILASVIGIILFVVIICKTRKNSTKIIVE